jgi:hypothetical protein
MPNIKPLSLVPPDKKVIKYLLYVHKVKINDPRGRANFDPRAII